MTGAGMGAGAGACATGDGVVLVTGFGLSLEHPTATEQMIRMAAKTKTLMSPAMFFPQESEERVLRIVLMRVIVVASCRVAAILRSAGARPFAEALIWRGLTRIGYCGVVD